MVTVLIAEIIIHLLHFFSPEKSSTILSDQTPQAPPTNQGEIEDEPMEQ